MGFTIEFRMRTVSFGTTKFEVYLHRRFVVREGQEGFVYGRKARLIKIYDHCIRVLYLEEENRYRLFDAVFVPFEANVPRSAWTT